MNYKEIAKRSIGHLYQSHTSIRQSGLDNKLIALAELRTSQLNGCSYCCTFHANELREMGISNDLIDKIPGYRHSASFDERQDLVLMWTDAVTNLSTETEDLKEKMLAHFTESEFVELTTSIALMNALTRLRIILGEKY